MRQSGAAIGEPGQPPDNVACRRARAGQVEILLRIHPAFRWFGEPVSKPERCVRRYPALAIYDSRNPVDGDADVTRKVGSGQPVRDEPFGEQPSRMQRARYSTPR
jgi:hypothetical protein